MGTVSTCLRVQHFELLRVLLGVLAQVRDLVLVVLHLLLHLRDVLLVVRLHVVRRVQDVVARDLELGRGDRRRAEDGPEPEHGPHPRAAP